MFTKVKKKQMMFFVLYKKCVNSNLTIVVRVGGWIKKGARYFFCQTAAQDAPVTVLGLISRGPPLSNGVRNPAVCVWKYKDVSQWRIKGSSLANIHKNRQMQFACLCISTITLLKILARLMLVIYIWEKWNESQADWKRRLYDSESSSSSS